MITLRILKLLEDNGFGTVDLDGTLTSNGLFFEKMPQGKTGVAIFSRGAAMGHGIRYAQAFDLYSRGTNDVEGYEKLEQIVDLMINSFTVCDLPSVDDIDDVDYNHCSIVPISNIQNAGQDENDRVVYTMTAQIIYSKTV